MSAISSLTPDEVDWNILDDARHLHLTGITAALSKSCSETVGRAASEAKLRKMTVSLDVNYRAKLWNAAEARTTLKELMPMVDLLICTSGDCWDVFEICGEPVEMAQKMRSLTSAPTVVVTAGEAGIAAATGGTELHVPVISSVEIDRVGAGDAFGAGLLDGYLDSDLERGLRFGAAMAALKRTMPGDEMFSTREDIESLAAGITHVGGIRR